MKLENNVCKRKEIVSLFDKNYSLARHMVYVGHKLVPAGTGNNVCLALQQFIIWEKKLHHSEQ